MRTPTDALLSVQRYFAGVLPEPWDVRRVLEDEEPARPFALVTMNGAPIPSGDPKSRLITTPYTVHCYLPEATTRKAADDAALELMETLLEGVDWGVGDGRPQRIPLWDYADRDARQRVTIYHYRFVPLTGHLTLSFEGQVTPNLPPDAAADDVRLALEELPNLAPGDVLVTGQRGSPWRVSFAGARAGAPQPLLVVDTSALVGHRIRSEVIEEAIGQAAPHRGHADYLRVIDAQLNRIRDPQNPRLITVVCDLRLTFRRGMPLPSEQTTLQSIGATYTVGGP